MFHFLNFFKKLGGVFWVGKLDYLEREKRKGWEGRQAQYSEGGGGGGEPSQSLYPVDSSPSSIKDCR